MKAQGIRELHFDPQGTAVINDVDCQRWEWPEVASSRLTGLGAMWISTPAGSRSTWDEHDDVELVVGVSGRGALHFADGRVADIAPGTAVVVPSRTRHAYQAAEAADFLVASVFWVVEK